MKKHFKIKSIAMICALAVAGIFGIGSAVINSRANEQPTAEKAEAATRINTTVYLKLNASYWGSATAYYRVHVWGGNDDRYINGGSGSGSAEISFDVSGCEGFTGIVIERHSSSSYNNRWNSYKITFTANRYNYFENNGWQSYQEASDGFKEPVNANKGYYNTKNSGWYLVGTGINYSGSSYSTSWSIDQAKAPESIPGDGNAARWLNVRFQKSSTLSVKEDDKGFKLVYFNESATGGSFDWANAKSAFATGTKAESPNGWFSHTDSDQSKNIRCEIDNVTITYNIYLKGGNSQSDDWKIYISRNFDVDIYTYHNNTLSSKVRTDSKTSDEAYNPTQPSIAGYSFNSWHIGTYNGATWTSGSYLNGSVTTLVATYDVINYVIPIHFIIDGVNQNRLDGGTTISGTVNDTYGSKAVSLYGYQFDGFYSTWDGSNLSGYLDDTNMSGTYTSSGIYAKLSALSTNTTYYIYTAGYNNLKYSNSDARPSLYMTNGTRELNNLFCSKVEGIDNLYKASIPSDCTKFNFFGVSHSGGVAHTADLGSSTATYDPEDHNLFVVTKYTSEFNVDDGIWTDISFYLDVSSDNFAHYERHDMHEPTDLSNHNIAEASEISISNGQKVRGYAVHPGMTGTGDGYTTYTTQGASVTNWSSLAYSGSTKSFNFYLSGDGKIYIVDNTDIQNGGYLYISDIKPLTDIHITVQVNSSTTFNFARLSTIDNASSSTGNLIFNGVGSDDGSTVGYLIRIPVYNLRGSSSVGSDTSYTVTLAGTVTKSSLSVPINTKNYNYYINLASSSTTFDSLAAGANDNPVGLAAKCAFATDKYIDGCKYSSVCAMPQATALVIKGYYEVVSGTGSTLLSGTKIRTWGSGATYETVKNGTYTTIEATNFSVLYTSRILPIATGSVSPLSANRGFSPFNLISGDDESNLSTIIIIAASSVALLSITALSILVIKKRKSKEQE